jgi:hypothetical protein
MMRRLSLDVCHAANAHALEQNNAACLVDRYPPPESSTYTLEAKADVYIVFLIMQL